MARFVCTGDLHLGAGADLGVEPGERLAEQAAVWRKIVGTANELGAPLLFAGDAWERRRPTPVELLAFRDALHWLKFPALIIPGNHDVEAFDRPTGYDVFLIDGGRAALVSKPKVVSMGGASIACLPWAPPGRLVALESGGDRDEINRRLADGLLEIARGLSAQCPADRPKILLAHWSVGGATTPGGASPELFREPVLDLAALEAIGFDAVVLGHIHKPQMLGERAFYVGSPLPLNFGEARVDHVAWILDVEPGDFRAFQVAIPSTPLVQVDVDLRAHPESGYAFVAELADVSGALVKARVRATEEQARRLDVADLRAGLAARGARKTTVQIDVEPESTPAAARVDETLGDAEALEVYLEAAGVDEDRLEALLERHVAYLEAVA